MGSGNRNDFRPLFRQGIETRSVFRYRRNRFRGLILPKEQRADDEGEAVNRAGDGPELQPVAVGGHPLELRAILEDYAACPPVSRNSYADR